MNVSVEIAFSFKRELDDAYRSLELPEGATVLDAFRALADRHCVFRERVFDEAGEIRRNITALVNGGNVQFREQFDTVLTGGDRLSVLPPVGGG
ncbi:MoaD/ThiS family protein [Candidatus Bipolaricaulota bacterium]